MDNSDLIRQLGQIVDGHIYTDKAALYALTQMPLQPGPGSLPIAAAAPGYLAQILELLEFCASREIQIRIRGAGTEICQRDWPQKGRWLLFLTSRLDRILEIDAQNQLARLQCGASLRHLAEAVREAGLAPVSGFTLANCQTAGGALAVNASELASSVQSLEIFSPARGREVFFAQNYLPGNLNHIFPLAPLFCGSYGQLGLIGEVVLKLVPAPAQTITLVCVFESDRDCLRAASQLMGHSCMAFIGKRAAEILKLEGACLLNELAGNQEAIRSGSERIADIAKSCAGRTLLPEAQAAAAFWQEYATLPAAFGRTGKHWQFMRLSSPPASLPEFVEAVGSICKTHKLEYAVFGKPGLGQCDLALLAEKDFVPCQEQLFKLVLAVNRLAYDEADLELPVERWLKSDLNGGIARIFDPQGLLSSHVS